AIMLLIIPSPPEIGYPFFAVKVRYNGNERRTGCTLRKYMKRRVCESSPPASRGGGRHGSLARTS
ncbi:hypothetical protein, partial [Anaerolinea sp.]|uniref:hypothetical protein n=1 Tax=Anaerolinea sp. TaxID=1872519 RepID=UPI002ACEBA57